jgi:hypothetical protein
MRWRVLVAVSPTASTVVVAAALSSFFGALGILGPRLRFFFTAWLFLLQ